MGDKKYRLSEIKLNLGDSKEKILAQVAKIARIKPKDIIDYEIVRESIDARKKPDIKLVYTIDFRTGKNLKLSQAPDRTYIYPKSSLSKEKDIVVVGFGPAGIFASLILAQMGYRPLVIERGREVDQRTKDVESFWNEGVLDENSNVQFGEGGAGTFSDGKLTTGISDYRIFKVLKEFHRAGGPDEILYKQKPHIGTDILKKVIKNIRQEIISLGGQIRFSTRLKDIIIEDNQIKSILVQGPDKEEEIKCDRLVLAIGHSARDTFRMAYDRGLDLSQKQFSMGVRIEHPQSLIDRAQYGFASHADILGAAEYKLSYRPKEGRGVYTFCMCPGGEVVMASSSKGQVLTNGMSLHARDSAFANSAILVDVYKEDFGSDHPLAGVEFQEKYEKKAYEISGGYTIPSSDIENFRDSGLYQCLPSFVGDNILVGLKEMGKRIEGFDGPEARLKGPETRSSSPIRFIRDENYNSNIKYIYPAGEGAGYAGGIMSAAVDGIKIAEKIVQGL